MLDALRNFFTSFRPADAADIAVVSVFLYYLLLWLRRMASRSLVVGLAVITGIYFAARHFHMELTTLLFQAGLAIIVVALIIVFQEDLRRTFDRFAAWGSLRAARRKTSYGDPQTIAVAAFELAANRVGALFVLPGVESVDRHLSGGLPLGGALSVPILRSIFDPRTPGHDGAILIRDARIERFGCHLPPAREAVKGRGTRHRAGLGLTERTDALTIIVSEEWGTVSVAEQGAIATVDTADALRDRIQSFYDAQNPRRRGHTSLLARLTSNGWIKLAAIALAFVTWIVLIYQAGTIVKTFHVSIEYRGLPRGLELGGDAPSSAQLRLAGGANAFHFLQARNLMISVDLSKGKAGENQVSLENAEIEHPPGTTVQGVVPPVVQVTLTSVAKPGKAKSDR